MARAGKNSACLICSKAPCECFAKPAKRAVPKQRKPEKVDEPKPKPLAAATDAMRQAAQQAKLEARRAMLKAEPAKAGELGEDDALFVSALRVLTDSFDVVFLDSRDIEPYKVYLDNPPTPGERAAAWRARRRLGA